MLGNPLRVYAGHPDHPTPSLPDLPSSQGFLGSCVTPVPPPFLAAKGSETYWPADTVEQYLDHFNKFRQTAGVRQ